ncbi:hypothetical protein [Sporosarcina limicola]|uniref:Fucose permease n=1 Tax=Sporosarcina limicola TaxID=34101 RepID=A0A927MTN4_9BACL|nr:hypothetical protein [Sporosarcina limicola]MBE1557184.1 fucose permease [Sporosarcina limicola]
MDWNTVFAVMKYSFMGIFVIFFVMDIVSKKSYKTYFYIALTIVAIFQTLLWNWSIGFKVGFIVLVIFITVKTISDVSKRGGEIYNDKTSV